MATGDKTATVTLTRNGVVVQSGTVTLKGGLAPVPIPPGPIITVERPS